MTYLIDGYNLMHAAGLMKTRFGPGGLEKARRALVGVLTGSVAHQPTQITIVFDGNNSTKSDDREQPTTHGIRVEFAPGNEGADARIERLIAIESAPKGLTVVSSDRRIRAAAKRRGAKSIDSESFWDQIVQRCQQSRRGLVRKDVPEKPGRHTTDRERWIREFQGLVSDDELTELAGLFADELNEEAEAETEAAASKRKPTPKRSPHP